MAIPSTNIELANDIYGEANGGYTSGQVSLNDISFYSYFAGPNGTQSISYNAYGRGENSGLNRIYGTNAVSNPDDMDDFKGVTYFYDNSTYQVTLYVNNTLVNSNPPPPAPPIDNAVNVDIELWGEGFSYQYLLGGGMAQAQGTFGPTAVSQTTDPIIAIGYWKVKVTGANPSFAGGNCNISINNNSKVTSGSVPAGSGGATFDSGIYGTENVTTYLSLTGLYFEITVS